MAVRAGAHFSPNSVIEPDIQDVKVKLIFKNEHYDSATLVSLDHAGRHYAVIKEFL